MRDEEHGHDPETADSGTDVPGEEIEELEGVATDDGDDHGEYDDEADVEERKQLAREYGWKSEDEWKGDPPKGGFVHHEEWIANAERTIPVMRAANRDLTKKVADLETNFDKRLKAETSRILKVAQAGFDMQRQRLEDEWANHIAHAQTPQESLARQQQRDKHLEEFDKQAVVDEPEPQSDGPSQDVLDAFGEFKERNTWFGPRGNRAMSLFADDVAKEIGGLPQYQNDPKAVFEEIERRVADEFGEERMTGKPKPNGSNGARAPRVDMGGGRAPAGRKKGTMTKASAPQKVLDTFKELVDYGAYEDTGEGWSAYVKSMSEEGLLNS